MSFNRNLYPPSGYVFTDSDGVFHRGDSWRDLFRAIAAYRTRNSKAPGDVEREVDAQHCASYPGLCHQEPLPPVPQPSGNTLNSRVLNWLGHMLAEGRRLGVQRVSLQVAKARADICATCPAQRSLSTVCEGCIASVASSRKVLIGDGGSVHKGLHPCGILGEDCQTSVHLNLLPETSSPLPGHCWRLASAP